MATVIKTKNGSGAPLASDLVQGELAIDLTNKRLYTENASGTVIELGTVPSTIDINGGTIDGTVIGGSSAAAGTFTTLTASGEISANGGIALGDNDKATFGAGDDLQIYHDGSHSFISDVGVGRLYLQGTDGVRITNASAANMISAVSGDGVYSYYNGGLRLATTATGIDVTGTVTADGLSVDGATPSISTSTFNASLSISAGIGTGSLLNLYGAGGISANTFEGSSRTRFNIANNGDVSLFEDTGTTAKFYWDASAESLGIGTTTVSNPFSVAQAVQIGAVSGTGGLLTLGGSSGSVYFGDSGSGYAGYINYQHSDDSLRFGTGTSERMRIDASGKVGIGTTSPQEELHIEADYPQVRIASGLNVLGSNNLVATVDGYATNGLAWRVGRVFGSADMQITNERASAMTFATGATERMRIDNSGNLLVGKSSTGLGTTGFQVAQGGSTVITTDSGAPLSLNREGTDGTVVGIWNDAVSVGTISVSGSSTAYNTSSDYRLKEDVQPMANASDRLMALKPVNFAWKADGSRVDGFIAHEAQEVVPEAVHGVKDGMTTEEYEVSPAVYEDVIIPAVTEERLVSEAILDEDGNELEPAVYETVEVSPERTEKKLVSEAVMGTREVPDYQGIDQSKLVPLLTKALQEALLRIEALEAQVGA